MKQEKKRQKEFEALYTALNQVSEEYQEYFKALAALPPPEPLVSIEDGHTTTPYGESEHAGLE